MSFRINTNIASLQSREYLRQTSEGQARTIARVTSGLRIVSSGDDAAGLAVANTLASDQAVITQGIRNANDGLSTLQTIDGGINNITKLLVRARTLATQSSSATFTGDRNVLNAEFKSVITEVDRQAQAIGLNNGGTFAKSLSVFIGGGRAGGSQTAISNGSASVDLSNSTVDARSLGLRGVQAQGVASVDIGTGSASTSVQAIVNNTTNTASLKTPGYTDFFFRGSGYSGANRVQVSVNLSGVSTVDNAVTALNAAIDNAGNGATAAATAFRNAGVRATVVTDANGKKSIGFTSSNSVFQVSAGDRLSNALLGNVTSASDPTGLAVLNTTVGGNATAASGTTFGASGAGTVIVRFGGSGLASPVDISLTVASGTTIDQALTSLTSAVAQNSALQAAGVNVQLAIPSNALVFESTRGERLEVSTSGDLNDRLGLGRYRSSGGASGTFDYSSITGSGGTFAASLESFDISIGGGNWIQLDPTPAAATIAGATNALNQVFNTNTTTAAAGLVATNDGTNITIASTNGSKFRLFSHGSTNVFGFNSAGASGAVDVAETQSAGTAINSFVAGGSLQTSLVSFTGIRNGGDDQTISFTANDTNGTQKSLAVVLRNDTTLRNAGTVDEAINAINNALQESNDATLQQIVAVKDKATSGGSEGIRFISSLPAFKVGIGTNEGGTGLGSQGQVLTASTIGTGSTADISTQDGGQKAVTGLAEAVAKLGQAQATVGRGQNQFNFAVNLAQSQLTNLAASESRIRDADLAEEAAQLTKAGILLQAGISALAQANSAPQQVLSLLRG